jgi:hypothetical protein
VAAILLIASSAASGLREVMAGMIRFTHRLAQYESVTL